SRSERLFLIGLLWALLWLLFGLRIDVSVGPKAWLSLGLAVLAPLGAAWAVQRLGARVIPVLAGCALIPGIWFYALPQLSFVLGPVALSLMLLGIAGGALFAAVREPGGWSGLVRAERTWLLVPAFGLLWLSRFELPWFWPGFGVSIDLVGGVVALLLV